MPFMKILKTNYVISKKKDLQKWLEEILATFIGFIIVATIFAVAFYFIFNLIFWFLEQYALLVS